MIPLSRTLFGTGSVRCMKTRGAWTCAFEAGHKGPCGFDRSEAKQYRERDRQRHRDALKLHLPDPLRN